MPSVGILVYYCSMFSVIIEFADSPDQLFVLFPSVKSASYSTLHAQELHHFVSRSLYSSLGESLPRLGSL